MRPPLSKANQQESAILRVRLTPKGGRNEVMRLDENGILHARVSAPPVDGAANRALQELLSDVLGVARTSILFDSGETSRIKTLRVLGLTADLLNDRIATALTRSSR